MRAEGLSANELFEAISKQVSPSLSLFPKNPYCFYMGYPLALLPCLIMNPAMPPHLRADRGDRPDGTPDSGKSWRSPRQGYQAPNRHRYLHRLR